MRSRVEAYRDSWLIETTRQQERREWQKGGAVIEARECNESARAVKHKNMKCQSGHSFFSMLKRDFAQLRAYPRTFRTLITLAHCSVHTFFWTLVSLGFKPSTKTMALLSHYVQLYRISYIIIYFSATLRKNHPKFFSISCLPCQIQNSLFYG